MTYPPIEKSGQVVPVEVPPLTLHYSRPALLCVLLASFAHASEPVDYQRQIKPILAGRCASCHGALKSEGELRLDHPQYIAKGSQSGPIVVAGKPSESLLLDFVTAVNGVQRMPPEGAPLTDAEVSLLKAWIEQGAHAPDEPLPPDPRKHWSFQLPQRPQVPTVNRRSWVINPIDAFVDAEHERHELSPRPAADKAALLRRVNLDLIGLPPTREEVRDFLNDKSAVAYDKVVMRLLDSPHYAERWGRHWMDIWRYSDWDGYGAQVRESKPHIWRWRDWIIESLNNDKPYDQMIVEMLAGDETAPEDPATLRATGFLVRNWMLGGRNLGLENTVEHTAKAFLGITLNCARCHDHMYDPISQRDYYRFRAFFEPHDVRTDQVPGEGDVNKDGCVRVFDADTKAVTYLFKRGDEKQPDKDHPLTPGVPQVLATSELEIHPVPLSAAAYYPSLSVFVQQESLAKAKADLEQAEKALSKATSDFTASKQKIVDSVTPSAATPAQNAEELGKEIAKLEETVALTSKNLAVAGAATLHVAAQIAADRAKFSTPAAPNAEPLALAADQAQRRLALCQAEHDVIKSEQQLRAVKSSAKSDDAAAKKKITDAEAALTAAKKSVETAQAALGERSLNYKTLGPVYPSESSGRRTALARWIVSPKNPLAARVAVNHIWLRHIGSPLVSTVFDFGVNGKAPTHPALLDWLAVELIENGWKTKHLHRLIVMSNTYRMQSSGEPSESRNRELDPDNHYLWQANTRRMEAETVRDATLFVSGQLDRTMSGPDLDPNTGFSVLRRSIYFRCAKEKKMTFLSLFDSPNVVECYRRAETIAPQQALAMVNSGLTVAQSRILAQTLSAECGTESSLENQTRFVEAAFEQLLCRSATETERQECLQFLGTQAELLTADKTLTAFTAGSEASIKPSADPRQRARENLIHVLLNHNDFLTIR